MQSYKKHIMFEIRHYDSQQIFRKLCYKLKETNN